MTKKNAVTAATAIVAGLALAVAIPLSASAHDALVASTPTANSTLTELPDDFSITMNEPLLVVADGDGFALQIRDAAGGYYGDGCLQMKDATMSMAAALGAPGEYTMLWQIVSEDGHTVDGEVPFTWQPSNFPVPSVPLAAPPVCGVAAPEPSASATEPPTTASPVAEAPTASAVDLPTVLWIGGGVLAAGIAVAVAIVLAGRRKPTP
jgi:methionine-rich copper-binding protein CopC